MQWSYLANTGKENLLPLNLFAFSDFGVPRNIKFPKKSPHFIEEWPAYQSISSRFGQNDPSWAPLNSEAGLDHDSS